DMDILKEARDFEVGLTATTADDNIRKLFEPNAPSINDRVRALEELHRGGIRTYAMIAPILPGVKGLAELLKGKVDYIVVDRMNYDYAGWVYQKYGMVDKMSDDYFYRTGRELTSICRKFGIDCRVVF
ncbi:MAG TPA: radical SAM protein, partial [Thermodesulfobacteriota bacterium]|nr:radical SAM protein [Thermodesulfobacteriota bacterium]